MKKHALISSVLVFAFTNDCMELSCRRAQLTPKAQERISQEPLIPFNLTNEEIDELKTIIKKRKRITQKHSALVVKLSNGKTTEEKPSLILNQIKDLKIKQDLLTHKLDIVGNLDLLQPLKKARRDIILISEKDFATNLEQNPLTTAEFINACNQMLNTFAYLYQTIQAIQQFAKNNFRKFDTIDLYENIESNCSQHTHNLVIRINIIVNTLERLSQTQTSPDK